MACDCSKYEALDLSRESIDRRIEESPALQERLAAVAENPSLRLHLYRCPECGQLWQSGWEWNFGGQVYLFQVPPIDVADWLGEPYQQPAALLIHSAIMRDYLARGRFEPDDQPCREESCAEPALRTSLFCKSHHIISLQQSGVLPSEPPGRIFAPYIH